MINHARTLLLNTTTVGDYATYPGEEYISADFVPLKLTSTLLRIRAGLFGSRPDRLMLNYRGRQLMSLLHATELSQFVLDLDPRVTYDHTAQTFYEHPFGFGSRQYTGCGTSLYLQGETLTDPSPTGLCRRRWSVDVISDSQVSIKSSKPAAPEVFVDYTSTDGLSSLITLPETSLSFRFNTANVESVPATRFLGESVQFDAGATQSDYAHSCGGSYSAWETFTEADWASFTGDDWARFVGNSGDPVTGDGRPGWLFQVDFRPRRDLGVISGAFHGLGDEAEYSLFGVTSGLAAKEPFKTFRNLWRDHDQLAYKFGGLLMAYLYQCERIRKGG